MRLAFVIVLAFLVVPIGLGQAGDGTQTKCTLPATRPLELRGLRLGMTFEEVRSVYPNLTAGNAKFGFMGQTIRSTTQGEAADPRFSGVDYIDVRFLDERLVFIHVNYSGTTRWDSVEHFAQVVAENLGLDYEKFGASNGNSIELACEGMRVRVSVGSPSITIYVSSTDEIVTKRRREQEEARRRAFKP